MRPTFFTALIAFAFVGAGHVLADVVTMKDGRRFEGTVVADRDDSVSIDTVVSTIRVTLKLNKGEVEKVEKKALPAGFFNPPAAEARVSDPTKFADTDAVYLEVPIKGQFGKDVTVEGVRTALSYCHTHGIKHVVFVIDSSGGDLDEATEIYNMIKSQFGKLKMHAIVQNCLGDALAVPAVCDTINLLPGAKIGGLGHKIADISKKHAQEDEEVFRQQTANELEAAARQRGRGGQVIRAMVDTQMTLAAWRNDKDEVVLGREAPAGLAADRIVFQDGPDTVLMLNYEQAIALGLPPFKGGPQELGKLLDYSQWQAESGYGILAMARAAAARAGREDAKQAAFDATVKNNVTRRQTAEDAINHNMKQASEWAPTKESYATYQAYASRWNWGWGRGYRGGYEDGGSYDTNRLTAESRRKWRDRTDASMYYLVQARSAMQTMRRLDAEAVKLGLQPNYKTGELDAMIKDIEVKVTYLNAHRIKTTE